MSFQIHPKSVTLLLLAFALKHKASPWSIQECSESTGHVRSVITRWLRRPLGRYFVARCGHRLLARGSKRGKCKVPLYVLRTDREVELSVELLQLLKRKEEMLERRRECPQVLAPVNLTKDEVQAQLSVYLEAATDSPEGVDGGCP